MLQSVRLSASDASRDVRYPVRQHFGGLEIQTETPIFDPQCFTMMDFRVEQQGGVSFVYILLLHRTERWWSTRSSQQTRCRRASTMP